MNTECCNNVTVLPMGHKVVAILYQCCKKITEGVWVRVIIIRIENDSHPH